jgi:hypothetical protein
MTNKEISEHNVYLQKQFPEMFVAVNCHKTHKNEMITFKGMEYLRSIYMDKSDYIVFKKSTQMGISEYLTIRAVVSSAIGRGVFYVMPTGSLVSRFVKNRVDRSINFTPFYSQLVRRMSSKSSESISLKHIGKGSIAFIGSNASAGFTEYPADDLIIDELDECDQTNLSMAVERLSASTHKKIIKVGNPTMMDFGIDSEYNKSDMKEWFLKCEHCGEWQYLDFFTHVVEEVENGDFVIRDEEWERNCGRDIRVICSKCNKPMDRQGEGQWVSRKGEEDCSISGYHISKIFSKNFKIIELMDRFEKGQTDDSEMQRFYNGDLGVAYTSSGAKINYDMLRECMSDYSMPSSSKAVCIAGVDVGAKFHTLISERLPDGKLKLVFIGMIDSEEELIDTLRNYNARIGDIDALPERNLSKKICSKFRGFFRNYYGDVKVEKVDINNKIIMADRTSSLDSVKSAILNHDIMLPRNADKLDPLATDGVSEFFYELCTSTRVYNREKQTYSWVEGGLPDHFFHAMNYMLLANRLISKSMK